MGNVKIDNKLPEFIKANEAAMDRALNKMVSDILSTSKHQVPVGATRAYKKATGQRETAGTGALKSSGRFIKINRLHWWVLYNIEYAAYQEFGQRRDGSRKVKHYSLPGKKAFYLRDPGDLISSRAIEYFKNEAGTVSI